MRKTLAICGTLKPKEAYLIYRIGKTWLVNVLFFFWRGLEKKAAFIIEMKKQKGEKHVRSIERVNHSSDLIGKFYSCFILLIRSYIFEQSSYVSFFQIQIIYKKRFNFIRAKEPLIDLCYLDGSRWSEVKWSEVKMSFRQRDKLDAS